MDIKQIKTLIKLVEESNISGLCVTEGENTIDIQKQAVQVVNALPAAPVVPAAQPQEPVVSDEDANLIPIESPMVGVFYNKPTPDSDEYVSVGSTVSKGQVVCILEAMKLFNEIESDVQGTIEKVLVQNEAPVEFGQPLFLVRPN